MPSLEYVQHCLCNAVTCLSWFSADLPTALCLAKCMTSQALNGTMYKHCYIVHHRRASLNSFILGCRFSPSVHRCETQLVWPTVASAALLPRTCTRSKASMVLLLWHRRRHRQHRRRPGHCQHYCVYILHGLCALSNLAADSWLFWLIKRMQTQNSITRFTVRMLHVVYS